MDKKAFGKTEKKPTQKIAKWAMWLGLSTTLIFPTLGIFVSAVRPLIDRLGGERIGIPMGFSMLIISMTLSVVALCVCAAAYKKGDRSAELKIGFIAAALTGVFWIIMVIGEFVSPH